VSRRAKRKEKRQDVSIRRQVTMHAAMVELGESFVQLDDPQLVAEAVSRVEESGRRHWGLSPAESRRLLTEAVEAARRAQVLSTTVRSRDER
jgi:hypothetical protein